ncbi:uncharacterized protein LOC118434501 [Folsomia candida]|nr:uncharacterized protein LOC118434501 [Folsomia candida]
MINCSVPATATAASRKTPNCVYFSKEFCTRKYGGMKWKGSVCPTTLINQQDYKCKLRALGDVGGVEVAGTTNGKNKTLNCRNSEALCLGLKPPFHTRSGSSDRNPPTQTMCLCPLGYTGPACSRMDIDLFHLDLLHNVDLRNILLKYQQKDRYFIGVTLLFLLVVTLTSVLLIVAGCSFLCSRLPNFLKTMKQLTSDIPYFSRPRASHRQSSTPHRNHHTQTEEQGVEIEDTIKGGSHRNQNTRGASSILCQMSSRMVTMCQSCLNRREEGEEDEDYYDSDLELRFHRARMERRQRLSQRGRVSV